MKDQEKTTKSQKVLYIIVAILVIASLSYRYINQNGLEQTALLFVGLPALITILVIRFVKTPKSLYGIVLKTITIFLLMSGILLGEGIACIIFAAPIFYGVGALVVFIYQRVQNKNKSNINALVIIPVLLVISESFAFFKTENYQTVSVERIINNEVTFDHFNSNPELINNLPLFFKLGFPKPILVEGEGFNEGDIKKIHFESSTKGVGVLELKIIEKTANRIVFEAIKDNSHIDHWLSWGKIDVILNSVDNESTLIKWNTTYKCNLSPSWYFEPLEKYAVIKSTNFLIDSYFLNN